MYIRNTQKAFTLTELLAVVFILGILLATAGPSIYVVMLRRNLISATEYVYSDLVWARGEAINRNVTVTVIFTPGDNWGYQINSPTETLKSVSSSQFKEFSGTNLSHNFVNGFTEFEPVRGALANVGDVGTVSLVTTSTQIAQMQTNIVLSIVGRARICSVLQKVGDYPAC